MKIEQDLRAQIARQGDEDREKRVFRVYVFFEGSLDDLDHGGIELHPTLGGSARGTLSASEIETLAEMPGIQRIELPQREFPDLNETVPHIRANTAWTLGTGSVLKGAGVVVAVIDSGIDVLHESFQDGSGNTRILALWDQTFDYDTTTGAAIDSSDDPLTGDDQPRDEMGAVITQASNRSPATHPVMTGNAVDPAMSSLDWGAEFTRAQIDTALDRHRNDSQAIPISLRDDPGASNHGTHVAGIAAGDGSMSGNCHGGDTFIGVAPEAWLLIVKVGFSTGKKQDINAALDYAFTKVRNFQGDGTVPAGPLPMSVNMSLGRNTGQHNGFSPGSRHQQTILSGSTGEAIVRSAGNSRNDAIHAAVTIPNGGTTELDFAVATKNSRVSFWLSYPVGRTFNYKFTLPGVAPRDETRDIGHADATNFNEHGHTFIPSPEASLGTDPDDHASLKIANQTADTDVVAGTWKMTIENTSADDLHLHIWSSSWKAGFMKPAALAGSAQNPNQPEDWLKATIGVDASGDEVIAVGAFALGATDVTIAPFSSQGPAPVGLTGGLYPAASIAKPDISAPGVGITSAKAEAFDCFLLCECCVNNYLDMQGTSQASPHVAGVVALMLQADPTLTHTQIKQMLQDSTQDVPDLDTGWPPPEELFGEGPLDAHDAVQEVLDNLGTSRVVAGDVARARDRLLMPMRQRLARALAAWEARFGARPAWHVFAALISTHFFEVRQLINTQKRVGAVWQRNGGPTLVRSLVLAERDIDPPIPAELGEKRMFDLVDRLIPVLRRFAGPRLAEDIDRYEDLARHLPGRRFDEIDAMVTRWAT